MPLKLLPRSLAELGGARAHHLHDTGLELTGVRRRRPHQPASCRHRLFDLDQAACDLVGIDATTPFNERSHPCDGRSSAGYCPVTLLLVTSCFMPATLSPYSFEDFEAVLVDVVLNRDRVKVVEPEIGHCLLPLRLPGPGGVDPGICPPRKLAPERLTSRKVCLLYSFYP